MIEEQKEEKNDLIVNDPRHDASKQASWFLVFIERIQGTAVGEGFSFGIRKGLPAMSAECHLLYPDSSYFCTEGIEPLFDGFVSPVDLLNVHDFSGTFCPHRRNEQCHSGTDIR